MIKKIAVIAISILFILLFSSYNVSSADEDYNCYYVGGEGNGNFSSINNCIDQSSDGDRIYVYKGEYSENLIINKSIYLISLNKNESIINGNNSYYCVDIESNNVTIDGFLLKNSKIAVLVPKNSRNISILNNSFYNNTNGILVNENTSDLSIVSNGFYNNSEAIRFYNCSKSFIFNNTFLRNKVYTIVLRNNSNHNIINENKIFLSGTAVSSEDSSRIDIISNNISKNSEGICVSFCENLFIYQNYISNNLKKGINIDNSGFFNITNNSIIDNGHGIYINSCYNYSGIDNNFFKGNGQDKKINYKPPIIPGFEVTLIVILLFVSFIVFFVYLETYKK